MKKLVALLLLVSGAANAGEATLTWTAPTQNCDGSALINLASYSVMYGQAQTTLPLSPLSYTVKGLLPGTWWFSVAAVNSTGGRSEFVTVSKTVLPEDFKAVSPDVFSVVKRTDRFVLTKVGTVPIGTVCSSETVNGKYVVPRASVTWSGTVKADVVVATCQ